MADEGSRWSRADFDRRGQHVVVLEQGVLQEVLPVGVGVFLPGDEIDEEFVAVGQLLDVDQFPNFCQKYPSYF